MKAFLAEELLAKVLGWEPSDVAKERPVLQAMASLKYDAYEQFSPGLRFLESLALWLNQFEPADRGIAYRFLKSSLVFCSADEMDHLVETAYQDHIRPVLLANSAAKQGVNVRHVGRVASSVPFRMLRRQTLFLGLSDGARIDTFRRANPDLNHEQIWQTHELSEERVDELLNKLSAHVANISGKPAAPAKFRSIVLLDDFSASGSSYYAKKDDGTAGGKVAKFLRALADEKSPLHRLCDPGGVDVVILIYMATEQAIAHLRDALKDPMTGVHSTYVQTVQSVPGGIKVARGDDAVEFTKLIEKYYNQAVDKIVFDVHMQKGKTKDAKYGYADCGLPVILHHNTPNNSLAILWFYENCGLRGLFPRVQRHREMA
jgi:hypothetical protein